LALLARARPRLDTGGLLELARLHRRYGQWEEALDIWEPLAEGGERAALEALAKYLEHRVRDYGRALSLARRLESGEARERRCRRLALKLQGDERAVASIRNR
jgi:hypothetical protein